jgi:alpha,alpha-trehalase
MPRSARRRPATHGDAGSMAGGPFPPHVLREYAFLADGERGALTGPRGDICWLCVPGWDSDAVFASLIGGLGGYAVTPQARYVWGGHYEPRSLIWRSRWMTEEGVVECREALAYPGEPDRAVVLRRICAVGSPARLLVTLDIRAGFGRYGLRRAHRDERGTWTGRVGELYLRWSGAGRAVRLSGPRNGVLTGRLTVPAGEEHDLVLEISSKRLPGEPPHPEEAWQATEAAWRRAVPWVSDVVASRDATHACAVLTGMTSARGGMVAAATTSLPERAEAGRNYDYRYAWIRDQCYAGQAAAAAGVTPLLDSAVTFATAHLLEDGPALAPAYRVSGGRVPDQRELDLPGYPGGFDLVGNWVNRQFQLDAFGEALLLLAVAGRHGRLDSDGRRAASVAARAIASRWREKDAGIWEIEPQEWTHSRLICAAALRAAAASVPVAQREATDWIALADRIVADTAAGAVHESGRWQRSASDPGLDGALLFPPLRGAVPADDPRTVKTMDAYAAELTQDGYAYRFRHDERPLADAEGAFLLCGFVLALAYHQQGREVEAHTWFERNRAACGPPALLTEEYDVVERQLRGNLPQAFVHALLLESAARLARPWDGN